VVYDQKLVQKITIKKSIIVIPCRQNQSVSHVKNSVETLYRHRTGLFIFDKSFWSEQTTNAKTSSQGAGQSLNFHRTNLTKVL